MSNKVTKNLYLDVSTMSQIEILLTKPGTNAPAHGAWSSLVERLLKQHLKNLPEHTRRKIEVVQKRRNEELLQSL